MTISTKGAKIMLFGGLIAAGLIYLIFESSLSESDMIMFSYIWVPVSVAGAAIWRAGQSTAKYAITIMAATVGLLIVFFEIIFPAL